ncbi:hypothetical protein EYC80_003069 [Monilinia laxa]|uniref:Myb-like domain-containing protein n=1 Tax=Monilinia laxa TaxID=61186 RepID=A0A5N6KCK5_MONLA|nr:hypothetical protein EYC80_003069 [Monilinia laxa]
MPSQWDHRADKDLLLAIIEGNNLKAIEWPTISERLNQKGYSFTKEACRQHFQKIRKESRTGSQSVSSNTAPAVAPAKKRKSKVSSLEERNEEDDDDGGDDDGDGSDPWPSYLTNFSSPLDIQT